MDKHNHWANIISQQNKIEIITDMMDKASSIERIAASSMLAANNHFNKPTTLEYIVKGFHSKHNMIPVAAMNSILAIGQQYGRMFDISKALSNNIVANAVVLGIGQNRDIVTQLFQNQRAAAQLISLQVAIGGMSGHIANIYARNEDWTSLDDFAELTTRVVNLEEKLSSSEYTTKDDLEELKAFFAYEVGKIGADAKSQLIFWMTIITFIWQFILPALPISNNPNSATKQDIVQVQKQLMQIQSELAYKTENSITQRRCKIYLKPKPKSIVIDTLNKYISVVVLQTNHKWCYISYINQQDGLTENGWVLKKYLKSK